MEFLRKKPTFPGGRPVSGNVRLSFILSHSGNKKETAGLPVFYSDSFFDSSACGYDHGLAKLSLGLAMCSYSRAKSRDGHIRQLMQSIGCEEDTIKSAKFNDLESIDDSCGYCFAAKRLPDGSVLVPIAIRSIGYGGEWVSNAHAVSSACPDFAAGFKAAADRVYAELWDYIAAMGLRKSELKLWIVGFSRGAAIANLLGARLTLESGISKHRIFVYTFASPNTVLDSKAVFVDNIFNIVSDMDIVPRLPFASWGFCRYGTDLHLPCAARRGREEYERLCGKMRAHFDTLMRDIGGEERFEPVADQELALDLLIDYLDDVLKSPERYEDGGYQGILMEFMRSKMSGSYFDLRDFLYFLLDGNEELAVGIFELLENWSELSAFEKVQGIGRLPPKLRRGETPAGEIVSMGLNIFLHYAAKLTATKVTGKDRDYFYDQLVALTVDAFKKRRCSALLVQHWPESYLSWLRSGDEHSLFRSSDYPRQSIK